MSRLWRAGRAAKLSLALVFLGLLGLGALFGLRAYAIHKAQLRVWTLREKQASLQKEIQELQLALREAEKPETVERMAREVLRWGYPDEELVILIRRR
ncbi:MAG: hypothetical protein ACK42E_00255 [Candidatus Bipolaricaulaceae bacterium]